MLQHSWLRVSTASSWTTMHTLIIVEHLSTLTVTRAIVQHWVRIFLRLSIKLLVVWLATITAVGWLALVGSMQERSHWEESEESAQLSRCLTDHLNSKAATNNATISILTVRYLHCVLQYLISYVISSSVMATHFSHHRSQRWTNGEELYVLTTKSTPPTSTEETHSPKWIISIDQIKIIIMCL